MYLIQFTVVLNPQPLISEIKKPHYIFISHPFTDHCNKETLLQFDPTIPIIAETNTLTKIKKVTSGSTPKIAEVVDQLYKSIITAGTHKAPSLKVAEASKAIENAQRDVNISFVNELALIFDRMGIDTNDVLDAAGTKWNFLKYKPGLVGGHCIGVDPYYLTHKAQEIGYHPETILAGRRVNDNMPRYVAGEIIKLMNRKKIHVKDSRILVLGITFKENCPDIRNSKVVDVIQELSNYGASVDVYDPWANSVETVREYNLELKSKLRPGRYDVLVAAVAHDEFRALGIKGARALCRARHVIFDIKHIFPEAQVDGRL